MKGTSLDADVLQTGVSLLKAGRLQQAQDEFNQFVANYPQDARGWHFLGLVAGRLREFQRAAELLEKALRLAPGSAEIHHNLASTYRVMGRFFAAEAHPKRALAIKPRYAEAYFNYSAVRKFTTADSLSGDIEALLEAPALGPEDRSFLHFAAAKIFDDVDRPDDAMRHYHAGNAVVAADFEPASHRRYIEDLERIFDATRVGVRDHEPRAALPIFVLGMPRGGTTLVEQIIASHACAFGAGELPDIASIAGTLSEHAPGGVPFPHSAVTSIEVLRGFDNAYLQRLRGFSSDATRIANKTPGNYLFVELIRMILPGACIIHCRRDPLDTCLSCYFQRFRDGQDFSYSLAHLGFYYRMYERLMQHWRHVLRIPIFELDYETLVAAPEPTVKALLDFCELDWDPRCLAFHQLDRPVPTASGWQVRRPLYTSSVGRWRRYEKHLGPLIEALLRDP